MSNLFLIAIDVEESQLGPVLRLLNKTPGVARFHLDFDALPKKSSAKKNGGGDSRETHSRDPNIPRTKDVIIGALIEGPKNLEYLQQVVVASGRSANSVNAALSELRAKGITESAGTGLHKLTDKALAQIMANRPQAQAADSPGSAALPAPAPKKQRGGKTGIQAVIDKLVELGGAPTSRLVLRDAVIAVGLKATSIDGAIGKLKATGIVKASEPGVYEFTAKGKHLHMKGH